VTSADEIEVELDQGVRCVNGEYVQAVVGCRFRLPDGRIYRAAVRSEGIVISSPSNADLRLRLREGQILLE
jgi:hypothetical protein